MSSNLRHGIAWIVFASCMAVVFAAGCRDEHRSSKESAPPTPSPSADESNLPDDIRMRAQEATVFIETRYRPIDTSPNQTVPDEKVLTFSGSGVIVSTDGLILTNAHVAAPVEVIYPGLEQPAAATPSERMARKQVYVRDSVTVWIHCGTERAKKLAAQVLCTRSGASDLALLRVRHRLPLTALPVADALLEPQRHRQPQLTQKVWALGFPLGRSLEEALESVSLTRNPNGPDISIRGGQITALRHGEDGKLKAIEHSCQCEHGNSGGPVINGRGELVGLETWGLSRADFAIPLDCILTEFDKTLRTVGYSTVREAPPRRTLLVESSAGSDSGEVFCTFEAAYAAARDGDTIELGEGKHECSEKLDLAKSVWIRGAGTEQTTLNFKPPSHIVCSGYVEFSDLSTSLFLTKDVGREAYMHDLSGYGISLDGASANIVNCAPKYHFEASGGATSRIEGLRGLMTLGDCSVTMLACDGRSTPYVIPMGAGITAEKSTVEFAGCRFTEKIGLKRSTATFRDCLIGDTLFIDADSTATVAGCHFKNSSLQARSRDCTFKECYFQPNRFTAIGGMGEALVRVEDCLFLFQGFIGSGDEAAPGRFTYGIASVDKSKVTLKHCTFISQKDWARAKVAEDEGAFEDEGGCDDKHANTTEGAYRPAE